MAMPEYTDFIESKMIRSERAGFECGALHPGLFPHQSDIVKWACALGRAAVFIDTGLGKSRAQAAWSDQVHKHTGGDVLILAPLAVTSQTVQEAAAIDVEVRYCRAQTDVKPGITITNYEMLKAFDPAQFSGVVLDESSILKSFTGQTKKALLRAFKNTPYRLACTATPAPNDYLELGNHAEFLGVMRSNEMISRFFINDTMQAGSYRLKGHARRDFWQWMATWAVSMCKPSDMGYSDEGFDLPPLNIIMDEVSTESLPPVEGQLFRDVSLSATDLHKEMRLTAPFRAAKVAELVNSSPDHWLIWCNTNYEADELHRLIPDAVDVRGSDKPESKAANLLKFAAGEIRVLISKASIAGFGMNFQRAHNMAFTGLSYSYEQFYQAIRREWRFGQKHPVNVHVVIADSEGAVLDTIQKKEQEHTRMKTEMAEAISSAHKDRKLTMESGCQEVESGQGWEIYRGDCVEVAREKIADCSIDLSVYSPPFSNLYIYSDSVFDMGNTRDHNEFFEQYRYLARELYRITRDGRLTVIHCKDLPRYKNRDGAAGLYDFPGDCIRTYEAEGWQFHSRVTIWKDPVIEMQRTKNHGLLYKQLCKDSAASRQGMADYLIVMRKWGDESKWDAVTRGDERFFDYIGATQCGPGKKDISKARSNKERERLYSIAVWQRYASPVWFDVQQTNVLNIQQARESQDEKHIAPLQLDVIERAVELWSNPGDLVFSPFMGIGSEGVVSIKMNRRFKGVELKKSYFDVSVRNLRDARKGTGDLFDAEEDAA